MRSLRKSEASTTEVELDRGWEGLRCCCLPGSASDSKWAAASGALPAADSNVAQLQSHTRRQQDHRSLDNSD